MPDGTLETIDGRPALRFERTLPHPTERVWRAASEPDELGAWFPAAAPWGPTTGETFEAFGTTGEVLEATPPHRLTWTFATERYGFELTAPDDGGTLLVFTHVPGDGTPLAQTAAGWHAYLSRLGPLLDGEPLSEEDAHVGWEDVHERYATSFGVDPGPGRAFIAAHRARQG